MYWISVLLFDCLFVYLVFRCIRRSYNNLLLLLLNIIILLRRRAGFDLGWHLKCKREIESINYNYWIYLMKWIMTNTTLALKRQSYMWTAYAVFLFGFSTNASPQNWVMIWIILLLCDVSHHCFSQPNFVTQSQFVCGVRGGHFIWTIQNEIYSVNAFFSSEYFIVIY